MPNERLRDALDRVAITPEELATKLAVDPKTVERWITLGRAPHRRTRHAIAALVREAETYLWPDALTQDQRARVAESEVVHVYPHRAAVPADVWHRLFATATESVDILMYSGMFLPDQNPHLAEMLSDKAAQGVRVRILLGDPDSSQVAARGAEEGIEGAMASKIRNVLVHYAPAATQPGVEVRLHGTTLYNSLYRFDGDLLVNSHIYGFPAAHAPVLHVRKLSAGVLFDTYIESFKKVWERARPAPTCESAAR
ncbi:MAG: XRE family transcriptional regulator [Nocardioidaceae bacterium]